MDTLIYNLGPEGRNEKIKEILKKNMSNIKPSLDELEEFDLEFSTVEVNDVQPVEEYKERLKKVKKLLVPFLDKLMADPDKDIRWPNRDKAVKKFKEKLLDILDYGEDINK